MDEVRVVLADDELFVGQSPTGRALVIDVNRQRDSAPGPMHLLLVALGACTASDVENILKKKRQKITRYEVRVSATRRQSYPRIWENIVVRHILRGPDLSEKAVCDAVHLSETKYCSVSAMLREAATVTMTYEIQRE